MDKSFALYRYPRDGVYTRIMQCGGQPESLPAYEELGGKTGFVFAPFCISEANPLLVIRPDVVERLPVRDCPPPDTVDGETARDSGGRGEYGRVFSLFHPMFARGTFSKIVLSRCCDELTDTETDCHELFFRACRLYPRMFIALVSTPQGGTWLMATPEILIESTAGGYHTMAVAGTMKITGNDTDDALAARKTDGDIAEWSRKNIDEQRYVAQYVRSCLKGFAAETAENGPYTLRAGRVKHLASDFTFTLDDGGDIGRLISELHPTPAVCGIPKQEAYRFIMDNEAYDRRYYSGFAGPVNCQEGTHLYVTLRCMEICGRRHRLYAGGGLLVDSEEETEWLETEAKMETMRRCLAIRRT